jgi:hypothetical protein
MLEHMKDKLKMEREMDMESSIIIKAVFMMEIGKIT